MDYPNIHNSKPSTCVSLKMNRCNRIVANVFRKHLKPFQITDSQLGILFFVTKSGQVKQKQIANFLYLEKSTVNRNISRLVQQKYILTNEKMLLYTSKKGKDFLEKIIPHWENAMAEIQTKLTEEGIEKLSFLNTQLTK